MKGNALNKFQGAKTGKDILNLFKSKDKQSADFNSVPPANETEFTLFTIWSGLLGHEQFGVNDDFFQIGGNSLKGIQVVSRISREFSVEIQLTDIFLYPTVSQLAVFIKGQQNNASPSSKINKQLRPERIPLSFSQERLWFIEQMEESAQYHIPEVLSLKGNLNIKALYYAFQTIIDRHEVLRTVFLQEDGHAYQSVQDTEGWKLEMIDGSSYTQNSADAEEYIRELIRKPFNLSKDYMLRASLISLGDQEHLLVVTMHHIASDGWSISIIVKEVVELYDAYSEGRQLHLSPLPIQYADFAIWQRNYLQGEVLNKKIEFWKNKLKNITPLQLSTDYTRPAVRNNHGGSIDFVIEKELSEKIRYLSHQESATLYMTLLAAFKVLLHRYSGHEDICVGSPVANRAQQEVEGLIGFFVNTLALRNQVTPESTFTELLQQVKATTIEAYEHQEVPFEKIVEAVVKERDLSRSPLFQVVFALQNLPEIPQMRLGDVALSVKKLPHHTTKFDVTFIITETANGMEGTLEYATDLYNEATIVRMLGHYKALLASIVKTPQQKISELAMLPPAEEHQLLYEFNDTAVSYPRDKTIVDLFEEQVAKTPGATAVVFESTQLSYAQLNERANRLAHYLRSKGVREETLVPICLERSLEMITGILGILKAGGAYVPIDPEYPRDRISYMLEDTAAAIAITSKHSRAKLAATDANIEVIEIDGHWSEISEQPADNPQTTLTSHHLAYVIYTSGSTGKPKGVLNEHGGLVNRLSWAQDYYGLTSEDTVLQKTTFCFDVSVWELLWPLLVGSKLVFAKPDGHKDIEYLKSIIDTGQITMMHFVPSMLGVFLSDVQPGDCKGLKKVLCSGEALKQSQVQLFIEKLPDAELHNLYGPTEAAIDVTYWSLGAHKEEVQLVPIGRPVANTSIYILDSSNGLVPMGGIGEINIGGVQVARGYLNRAELSAERFVKDPFSREAGAKMYKTGDLGRWLPDGNIEYLGRIDEQVKIRGFRIELGEIEACISSASGIKDAKVIVTENDPLIGKKLHAYVEVDQEKLPLLNNYLHLLNNKTVKKSDLNILPNGLPILSSNSNEVKFLYNEIFKDLSYLQHGITLNENSCVIDIGANVGFFTVFLNILSENIKVYSFEPIPEVYDYLAANRHLYNIKGKAFQLALLDKEQEISFVYYPQMTILSGISEDRNKVKDVVRSYIENSEQGNLQMEEMDSLLEMKLESRKVTCKAKTLSQIIAEENIEKIDLLKVDVENSEHLVIQGISEKDWNKIESLIIEVHDVDGRLDNMKKLLEEKGFTAHVEKEDILSKDDILYNIYALRPQHNKSLGALGDHEKIRNAGWEHPGEIVKYITKHIEKKLPDYMIPSGFILLDKFPLTHNGKIDKKALPAPENSDLAKNEYVAPRTEIEKKLVNIWQELLKVERVGIHDNFFELGGHSLLAMRVKSSVRKHLEFELNIKALFFHSTICKLAMHLEAQSKGILLPAIIVQPRPEHIPLSFSQERLWFIDQLEGSVQYHLPAVMRLKGNVQIEAFRKAFQAIVERHEVLRTIFFQHEGQVYQSIRDASDWQLQVIDDALLKQNSEELRKYIQGLTSEPFDLSKDYTIRASLISLTEEEYVLVVNMHHIASDGWSISILVNQLIELYSAYIAKREPRLTSLDIQYADYAIWQRNILRGEVLDKQLNYWRKKLEGVIPLQLPTDYARTIIRSKQGAEVDFLFEKELSEKIQQLSRQESSTLYMTLLAAFKVLLHNYTGQQDICVGSPIANRTQQELEGLIGFFLNTLAIRSEVNGDSSFIDLLQQVKATTIEAYEHSEVPFEKVVDTVVKERDLSRTPLFQVMFILENNPPVQDICLEELQFATEKFTYDSAKFDITISILETSNGLEGTVRYASDLYSEATINRMVGHFKILLDSIVKAPQQNIGKLAMLTTEEEQQLLYQFNDSVVFYPKDKSIIDLFEEQAAKSPESLAVVFHGKQLTYQALNEKANQLAHYLRGKDVKEETLVPICIERSLEMIVGILGILKAGGAYVPIDTDFPQDRISYMLQDTGARVVLTSHESRSKLQAPADVEVIEIDRQWALISEQSKENLQTSLAPHHLAYVIYTSGSTGKPKGVMIEHRNLVDYVFGLKQKIQIGQCNSFALVSTLATDLGNTVIYSSLVFGGALHLFAKEAVSDVENLRRYFSDHAIDCLKIVPSHWKALSPDEALLLPVKLLVFGGEALPAEAAQQIRLSGSLCRVVNHYGPTETTIGKLLHIVDEAREYTHTIPIGRPFSNTQIFVLNKDLSLCPIGVPGQLYIAGDGVARGYFNNAGLTNEKFTQNNFNGQARSLMYGTGDLVKYLPDGNIMFIGRVDDQVKIRGYRIELGEIESALKQCEGVSQGVVLAREDSSGSKRLVGYVVPEGLFNKEAIITELKRRLPEYMVPVLWVELESLPLTANGKVDRKSLPDPDLEELLKDRYVAPANEVEEKLAAIWQVLLGIDKVGVYDNFFELGGDSILTIQVASQVKRLGYEMHPKDIFIHQTIGQLSKVIMHRSQAETLGEQGLLTGVSGLLPIQKYYLENQVDLDYFNQSVLLKIDKAVTEPELNEVIEQLIEHHDALRFKYYKKESEWQQEYSSTKGILIKQDFRSASEGTFNSLISDHANKHQQSLDIKEGELIRVVLMKMPESESYNRLLIVIHHLAIDGVSWRILLDDMELLLNDLKNERKTDLGKKSSSYRQWFDVLEKYGSTKRLLSQRTYWETAIKNYDGIPVDKEYKGEVKVKDIAQYSQKLDAEHTQLLLHEVPRAYHTVINDLLLCAMAMTLSEWSGKDKIIIGLEGHGRDDIGVSIDTDRTVGWFTSIYPVLLETKIDNSPANWIRSVKEQMRKIPDKGLGYGVLKYLNKQESWQGRDPWDVKFNYLGQFDNLAKESKWLIAAEEPRGFERSMEQIINEKFIINCHVKAGELVLNWIYSSKHYDTETITKLVADYISNLVQLINHCMTQQAAGGVVYTPSDYGLGSDITNEELDRFLHEEDGNVDNIISF